MQAQQYNPLCFNNKWWWIKQRFKSLRILPSPLPEHGLALHKKQSGVVAVIVSTVWEAHLLQMYIEMWIKQFIYWEYAADSVTQIRKI